MTLIKSISGIRGTIGGAPGNALTPVDIVKFTASYAATLPQRKPQPNGERYKVVVGKDARLSGDMVEQLVVGTLMGCGIDVVKCGFASTPTTEMAVPGECHEDVREHEHDDGPNTLLHNHFGIGAQNYYFCMINE